LKVPFTLCVERQTCLRLPHDNSYAEPVEWQKREDNWKEFWKSHGGKEDLAKGGKAVVGGKCIATTLFDTQLISLIISETFWLDLVLRNPLDAEVNLSNLTLTVKESNSEDPCSSKAYIEVELIDDLVLGAKELRTVRQKFSVIQCNALTLASSPDSYLCQIKASRVANDYSRYIRLSLPSPFDGVSLLPRSETARHCTSETRRNIRPGGTDQGGSNRNQP